MSNLCPAACPISGETQAHLVFTYDAPPQGEIGFRRPAGEPYRREGWQFAGSNHYVSRHAMTVATDYSGDYVNATYGNDAGLRAAIQRVIVLPPERSEPVAYMVSALRNKKDVLGLTALDINVGVLEIIDAAKESVKTGRAIPLPKK